MKTNHDHRQFSIGDFVLVCNFNQVFLRLPGVVSEVRGPASCNDIGEWESDAILCGTLEATLDN